MTSGKVFHRVPTWSWVYTCSLWHLQGGGGLRHPGKVGVAWNWEVLGAQGYETETSGNFSALCLVHISETCVTLEAHKCEHLWSLSKIY